MRLHRVSRFGTRLQIGFFGLASDCWVTTNYDVVFTLLGKPMNRFLIALLLVIAGVGSTFGQAPNPNDPLRDPYLRELIRRSKGSNRLLATSISDALRLKLDDLGNQFLIALAARKPDDTEAAQIANQIGADQLLRVSLEPQFTAPAKTQASALVESLRRINQSRERISPAIEQLSSDSTDQRLGAMRVILAGGDESVSLLTIAAAKEPVPAKRDAILQVLLRLGEGGPDALTQLAIYGDDALRAGALASLGRLGADRARPISLAAAYDPRSTDAERAVALQWLSKRYQPVPSREDVENYLLDRLAMKRNAIAIAKEPTTPTVIWTIGQDRVSVRPSTVQSIDALRRDMIDQARLLHRLGSLSTEATIVGLSADLAYRYALDPIGIREAKAELVGLWGEDSLSGPTLASTLESAMRTGDLLVAVAIMQYIDDSQAADAETLLTTYSEVPSPLVAAALHPQARVRYEAAAAIGRLGYASPYAGSSDVFKRWIEMTSLTREPLVLLLETRIEVAGQIERLMTSMGYRVEIVSSVEDAIAAVDRGGDLRFLIANTVLPDMSSLEMLDRIRRRPLGLDVPVILHGPIDKTVSTATEDARWAAPVVHVELPATAAGWSLTLEPLEGKSGLPSLSAVERYDFRRMGAESLGLVAGQPARFSFYDFDKLAAGVSRDALLSGESPRVPFGEPILAVLSVSPSRDAQSALVDRVILASSTADRRDAAADALLESVERNGVLLNSQDLLRLVKTRQSVDDKTGAAIDRVLMVISRRLDVSGILNEPLPQSKATQSPEMRVRSPDI